jgi:hypothetical protein
MHNAKVLYEICWFPSRRGLLRQVIANLGSASVNSIAIASAPGSALRTFPHSSLHRIPDR